MNGPGMNGPAVQGGSALVFTRRGVALGARDLVPVGITVLLFGVVFGLLARDSGLAAAEALLMSGMVFAGASQFAALALWQDPLPWLAILGSTLAVNARLMLLGAALLPWLRRLPRARVFLSLAFLTDANWAITLRRLHQGWDDLGHLLGGGLLLYVIWLAGTALGGYGGALIGDPRAWSIDVLPLACFVAFTVPFWRGPASLLPWGVAAGLTLALEPWLAGGLAMLVGALTGSLLGAWSLERKERRA